MDNLQKNHFKNSNSPNLNITYHQSNASSNKKDQVMDQQIQFPSSMIFDQYLRQSQQIILKYYQTPIKQKKQNQIISPSSFFNEKINFDTEMIIRQKTQQYDKQQISLNSRSYLQILISNNISTKKKQPDQDQILQTSITTQQINQTNQNIVKQIKSKKCRCEKSKCISFYCVCFEANKICQGCSCINCQNDQYDSKYRQDKINLLKKSQPNIFQRIIQSQKYGKGCNCKKSSCRKKYCQCFQAGVKCSQICDCVKCQNTKINQKSHTKFILKQTAKKEGRYKEIIE